MTAPPPDMAAALPCDVQIGNCTFRKGVKMSVLQSKLTRDCDRYLKLEEAARQAAEALEECAAELESLVEHHYPPDVRKYPSEQRRYERDIAPAKAARTALARLRELGVLR